AASASAPYFLLLLRPPPCSTLFPYTTLFRSKLAAATGESSKLIWQSMLELSGVKSGELIPAKHFALLNTWLQARQTLSNQAAPRSEEHTSELQSRENLVCRLLLEKKKDKHRH